MELQPESARYAYVLALALHASGRADEAISVLKQNLAQHPNDRDTLIALIGFNRDAGNFSEALQFAEELKALTPDDPDIANLILNLRRQIK